MTLRLSAVISADASQAKAALAQTTAGAKEAAGALDGLGAAGNGVGPKVIPPLQQLPPLMDRTASSTNAAAGSMGNLVANFNDIGMMMAAGQNPLMLAIQQGTQITQVIGPMGATGALRAMGGAVMSMLSPINLVTLGVIALGATAVQSLMDAGEATVSFSDRLSDMTDQVDAFRSASQDAALPWRELVSEFGSADPILRATLQDLAGIEKIKAFESIDATAASLREMVHAASMFDDSTPNTLAQRFLGFDRNSQLARNQAQAFLGSLGDLNSPDQSTQLQGALDLRDRLSSAAGGYGQMNTEQRAFYEGLTQVILQLQAMGVTVDEVAAATAGLTASQIAGYEVMARSRVEATEALAVAEAELATQNEKAAIAALIAEYGAGSVQVAEAKAAAARAEYETYVQSLGVSEDMQRQLIAAYDAANGIASAGMAGNIGAAAQSAASLAEQLGISLSLARAIAAAGDSYDAELANTGQSSGPDAARTRTQFGGGAFRAPVRGAGLRQVTVGSKGGAGAGSGGGGGAEADAVQGLIDRYQQELDLLREMDPVQEQMLRNRAALAEATEPQREAVEGLIRSLEREKEIAASREAGADMTTNYFMRVANGANAAQTAVDMFLESMLQAVIQGKGPLASLFGTSGTSIGDMLWGGGGLFGGLLGGGGKTPFFGGGRADGGMIHGFGGGRDDRVMIAASPGEMMINARATSRNRALLEFINGGGELGLPGFANGGMIGGSAPRGGGFAAPAAAGPTFSIDARGSSDPAEVERAAERGMRAALTEYSRSGLPRDLQRIQANPMRVG